MAKSTHSREYAQFRKLLARLRADSELSQRDLASRLRVHHSWVAKVETGDRRLDVIELIWWCNACDADPADVVAQIVGNSKPRSRGARG